MLGQGGLGQPNLAALAAGGPAGAVITPALFANANSFFVPIVALEAAKVVSPAIWPDPDTFFAPTVASGAVTVTPTLWVDPDAFFAPTLSVGGVTVSPALWADPDLFGPPAFNVAGADIIAADLWVDPDTFFAPTVAHSGAQVITPEAAFFGYAIQQPIVTAGEVTITPALWADPDLFEIPTIGTIGADQVIEPIHHLNENWVYFFIELIHQPLLFITPVLFDSEGVIYTPNLLAPFDITLEIEHFSDPDEFYAPSVTRETKLVYLHPPQRDLGADYGVRRASARGRLVIGRR